VKTALLFPVSKASTLTKEGGVGRVFWLVPADARIAIVGAAAGVALLTLAWFATFHISLVEHADVSLFHSFGEFGMQLRIDGLAHSIARLCNEKPYLCLCAFPVLVALARRRLCLALEIGVILVGANLTTHVLKQLLAHPRTENLVSAASWPSGHTTAATAVALCCVLAAPARLRPSVAICGAAFVIAVASSLLFTNTHYPSDIVAGFLVAGIWTLVGMGTARLARDARPPVTS
jgi:membrane-associated phospholipid phosphatase